MEKPPKSRMFLFLLLAVGVAAGMQILNTVLPSAEDAPLPPRAKVSKVDIRRAVALPFQTGVKLLNGNVSFIERYAERDVNLIVIDVPLHIRAGNPAYLEYENTMFAALEELALRIHEAGMEVALNPVFTGRSDLLEQPGAAELVFKLYSQWLGRAALTGADALYIVPLEMQGKAPASAVLEAIEALYENYTGVLYMHITKADSSVVSLYHRSVRGFIVHAQDTASLTFLPLADDSASTKTSYILDLHHHGLSAPDMFRPYIETAPVLQEMDIASLPERLGEVESLPQFWGMILPDVDLVDGPRSTPASYMDDLGVWYGYLKKVSRERAFQNASGLLR